ncbi:hypothetical protein F5X98DRAFT_370131 [Xylaria grammica]|nr:hypothetical protein F5X98DRAFT_370131 [Xylaria grammica]
MAKQRASEGEPRRREKKVSEDKVTKSGQQKRRAGTLSDTSDNESAGGASVDAKSLEGASVLYSSNIENTKSRVDRKNKKETRLKGKQAEVEVEADDDTTDGGAMLFSIDTDRTPIDLAVKTGVAETNEVDGEESGSKKTKAPSGLNRAARRRIKLIEKQRDLIKQKKGISEGSGERDDEVQKELDKWTELMDGRTSVRMEKKRIRKAKEQARPRTKRGKVLTGRALKEREKQVKKNEKKIVQSGGIPATNNQS